MGWILRPAAAALLASALASTASGAQTLVTLREGPALDAFERRFIIDDRERKDPDAWSYLSTGLKGALQVLESTHGFRAAHAYSKVIRGFTADLNETQIEGLRYEPLVESMTVTVDMASTEQRVPWGVTRVAAAGTGEGSTRSEVGGVTVYVVDSGIDASNPDLNVVRHVNFAGGPDTDCNGHGTHVAGIIGARDNDIGVLGVAPGVALVGVKVVDCSGEGTSATILKGIDWVAATATGPAVVNLSLGGGIAPLLDEAIRSATAQGIFFAIAAGNAATDACLLSPSLNGVAPGIVTVGASDVNEMEAPFSNFGGCVDLWAPGVGLASTGRGPDGGLPVRSGTSMAAPHVAGAAARFLSLYRQATPAAVEEALIASSVIPGTASKDGRTILRMRVPES
ncbi:MAG: S8 family peptidase [Vicinamibacteria bacterium]|nr:S8 family peptidase [Vicinamibacteria bacterium]